MAADVEFRIGANLAEFRASIAALRADLRNLNAEAARPSGPAFSGVAGGAKSATTAVGRLAAGFVSLAAAIQLIGAADELSTLDARIRLVTTSTEEYNRAQVALFDLAQRTRTSLSGTIGTYVQIAQAVKDAGVGQEILLETVETINKAVQLSGVNAASAQAALVQLTQGLGSGTLRGEELNSVLEQTGKLADVIAAGLGITRSQLRAYGEQGKITAQQVINALQSQRAEVNAQFAQLPVTVGQAFTQLKNASLLLIGAFDQSAGATGALASAIQGLADAVSGDALIGAIAQFAAAWGNALRGIVSDMQQAVGLVSGAAADITNTGAGLFEFIGRAFQEIPANVRAAIKVATVEIAAFVDSSITSFKGLGDYLRAVLDPRVTVSQAREQLLRAQSAIEAARRQSIDAALTERQQSIDAGATARQQVQQRRAAGRIASGGTGIGNAAAPAATKQAAAKKSDAEQVRKAELDAQGRLAEDASKRELDILRGQFDAGTVAARDYYRRRQEIELASLDASIATERQRASAGGAEGVKALADIELLERRKADVRRNAAEEQFAFERNLAQQRAQAETAATAATDPAAAARARAEAQYRDLLTRLQAEGDTAGVALVRKLINTAEADARLQELQGKVSATLGNMRAQEALVSAQTDAGLLPQLEGERQIIALREQSIAQLRAYRDALAEVAQAQTAQGGLADPRVSEQITQLDTEIARATASQKRLQTQTEQIGASSLSNLFTDLATGAKSFGDAVQAAALNFVQSLARMAAEALAKRAVLALSGAAGGGSGLLSAVLHGGGMVGGGHRRTVNPLMFAGAPRFHSGGMVGLRPDERPAILQTGEEVLSRADPRNAANGGGSGYRIVNVLDPALVSDYMDSAAGERTVLNVIGRNPGQVRQLLGA